MLFLGVYNDDDLLALYLQFTKDLGSGTGYSSMGRLVPLRPKRTKKLKITLILIGQHRICTCFRVVTLREIIHFLLLLGPAQQGSKERCLLGQNTTCEFPG